jgi:hypothetical protein
MNKLTATILMLCLCCQLVLKLSIVAWFEINQDYIASTLCENRNKPELVCCGKCVLTKQLKNVDDAEQKGQKNIPSKEERTASVSFVLPPYVNATITFNPRNSSVKRAVIPNLFDSELSKSIFHPPSTVTI